MNLLAFPIPYQLIFQYILIALMLIIFFTENTCFIEIINVRKTQLPYANSINIVII